MKTLLKIGFVVLVTGAVGLIWAGAFGYMPWDLAFAIAWKTTLVLCGVGAISAALIMMTAKEKH